MAYILVIWTVVATFPGTIVRDWRPIGDFYSLSACTEAAKQLNAEPYRCLKK